MRGFTPFLLECQDGVLVSYLVVERVVGGVHIAIHECLKRSVVFCPEYNAMHSVFQWPDIRVDVSFLRRGFPGVL